MYAFRKDKKGFRAIASEEDVDHKTETFSTSIPVIEITLGLTESEFLTQKRLDSWAQEKGYKDIDVAASYAGSIVEEYSKEGTKAKNLRDQTWQALYRAFKNPPKKGFKNFKQIEALLPELSWE